MIRFYPKNEPLIEVIMDNSRFDSIKSYHISMILIEKGSRYVKLTLEIYNVHFPLKISDAKTMYW